MAREGARDELLTFDDDLLSLVEGRGPEAGSVFVRQQGRQIGDVVKAVDAHLQERPGDDSSIEYL